MNVRPKFLRRVSIFFLCGLLVIAFVYFYPHINLPQRPRLNCPLLAQLKPLSKASVQATDSLELVTFIGKPSTPYTVRIYGDGRVERDATISYPSIITMGCPLHDADKHLQIPAAQAIALIAKARDGGFCRLCELYQSTHPVADGGLEELTLTFHGKTNRAINISGNPPPLFAELVGSFNAVSSIPEYATTNRPSKQRMAECNAFTQSQVDIMLKHSDQH